MRAIYRELTALITGFMLLWFLLWGFSYIAFPDNRDFIDTYEDSAYFSNKDPDYYIYGRGAGLVVRGRILLESQRRSLIVIGSSSSAEGFRPQIMGQFMDGVTVNNMSIGGSNVTQLKQVVELVYERIPRERWSEIHFVLGFFYALCRPDDSIWTRKTTNLQREMLRYGLYDSVGGVYRTGVDFIDQPTTISILRPIFFMDALIDRIVVDSIVSGTLFINNMWLRPMRFLIADDLDAVVVTDDYKSYVDKIMLQRMGTEDGSVPDEQFRRLLELGELVSKNGSQLTIVDLPMAKWHVDRSPHYRSYQTKKRAVFENMLALDGVRLIDMQALNDDYDFYDFAHPKPMTSQRWSRVTAKALIDTSVWKQRVVGRDLGGSMK